MTVKIKDSLTPYAAKEIKTIHSYSKHYNKLGKKDHIIALLELADKHVEEIFQLYKKRDKHYVIETGDLLILCFEIIKEAKCSANVVLAKCYKRYRDKLPLLIKEFKEKRRSGLCK